MVHVVASFVTFSCTVSRASRSPATRDTFGERCLKWIALASIAEVLYGQKRSATLNINMRLIELTEKMTIALSKKNMFCFRRLHAP